MDEGNISHLNSIKPRGSKAKVELLGKYDPQGEVIIEDPYFVGIIAWPVISLQIQCLLMVQLDFVSG